MYRAVGKDLRREMHGDIIGSIPADLEIPIIPFSPVAVVRMVLPGMIRARRYAGRRRSDLAGFLAATPQWCVDLRARIGQTHTLVDLFALWEETLYPTFAHACNLLRSVTMRFTDESNRLRLRLARQAGEGGAFRLMSHLNHHAADLASLMPVLSLSRVARGEISRQAYIDAYGHRGPHELELSAPGADEEAGWLDWLLADSDQSLVEAEARVAQQQAAWEVVWASFEADHPRQAPSVRRRLRSLAEAAQQREAVRSELTRITRTVRRFFLRAGEVTGAGEALFFLSLGEMAAVLRGDRSSLEKVPVRSARYEAYCSLPPTPSVIIGPFDPFRWADDPNRRSDLLDARAPRVTPGDTIRGFPGAAGRVEGLVRCIDRVEEGGQVRAGEILVTTTTNVGWTPLFPRTAAVVTDVGAPLSHAAIVAREMGIPAVVGCGDATMRLKTGDRVRVDGSAGTVERIGPGAGWV
jgi:pyruvate,water dikinase